MSECCDLLFLPYLLWHQQDPGAHRAQRSIQKGCAFRYKQAHRRCSPITPFSLCLLLTHTEQCYNQTHFTFQDVI